VNVSVMCVTRAEDFTGCVCVCDLCANETLLRSAQTHTDTHFKYIQDTDTCEWPVC